MSGREIETEQDEIDIDDPELLAELDAAMEEAERRRDASAPFVLARL
jgi:hypothetical protein